MSKFSHAAYLSVIAVLIGMVVSFSLETQNDMDTTQEHSGAQMSLAVLPFSDFGEDNSAAEIGATLTDEIRLLLARNGEFRIASHARSSQFVESQRDISEVGAALGVSWFLEGSIRIDKDRVRISTQLIDAGSDAHVWSEIYDGTIDDLEMIAADISEKVATAKGQH